MLKQPNTKYRPFPPVALADRQWPNRTITAAPIWMSTDLRDGNQALFEPMDAERKMRMFKMLCAIGFKEIEVAFPAASQTDFDFVRCLIEQNHIPDDVTIEVLTQARDELIDRTLQSLVGARRAIVHVYNATSRPFREMVFGMSKSEVIQLAVRAVQRIRSFTDQHPETEWVLEYSPETFTATELDFATGICDAVTEAWGATLQRKIILNLPATVEVTTPNIYADQIEWMHRHLAQRDSVILSVHPHNDRGTAVAAAELAVMAGADRVEGCLFGNGERTGNVDLVTLALNLYTQGIDPGLDFSNINAIARTAEECTQLPIHPRHPYVGDLVFTAFSGSHQDAIKKGFAHRQEAQSAVWEVPYLPIDPADVGRAYDSIIRINSQSGKGGIAYLMEAHYGIVMPRRLQVEFSGIVQKHTDSSGGEVDALRLWEIFSSTYLNSAGPLRYIEHHLFEDGTAQGIRLVLEQNGKRITLTGKGNGPLDAVVHALSTCGIFASICSYEERAIGQGADARAIAFIEIVAGETVRNGFAEHFGVGIDTNLVGASIRALINGVNQVR